MADDVTGKLSMLVVVTLSLLVLGMVIAFSSAFLASASSSIGAMNSSISTPESGSGVFVGVSGTPNSAAHPINSVSLFQKSTYETVTNTSVVHANSSQQIVVNANFYSTPQANVTFCYNNSNGTNATVKLNGILLGSIPDSIVNCGTYVGIESFLNPGVNYVNITAFNGSIVLLNSSLKYSYWATSVAYTLGGGDITPTQNGTFNLGYVWLNYAGYDTSQAVAALAGTQTAITGIPSWLPLIVLTMIMAVVLGLVLYIGYLVSQMQGGGQQ